MGPSCLPDRESPLGTEGTQSIFEPPVMGGGRIELPFMRPLSPFVAKPESKPCSQAFQKEWKVLARFPAGLVQLPKCMCVFLISKLFQECQFFLTDVLLCAIYLPGLLPSKQGKRIFVNFGKHQTNIVIYFCFSLLFITVNVS